MQTEDLEFSAIIPIIDTSKLIIKLGAVGQGTMNDHFSPSEKSKTCQGLSRSISSQDFGDYTLWDFILSLPWQQKQVLSSHAIKARNFPCLHMPVCGRNKQAERAVRLAHPHDRTLLLPPATDETFFLLLPLGSPSPNLLSAMRLLTQKGMFRARVTLLNRPKESHVSIARQSCCCSRSCGALCVCEENGERK